ncbi:MAG: hypothetical protein AAF437_14145 [Pseudomonadota bacterium]
MSQVVVNTKREFRLFTIAGTGCQIDAMVFGGDLGAKPALFILNSHEFAMPPSERFCQQAWQAGYQVVFVRRAGYARSTPLPGALLTTSAVESWAAVTAEAAMLCRFLDAHANPGAVVLSIGGSNPVAYRLCHFCKTVSSFVFLNPPFNQEVWESFSPEWFRGVLQQIVASKSGVRISSLGIKHLLRSAPISFYRQVLSQSPGDIHYVNENKQDFIDAGVLAQTAPPEQLFYELFINLRPDPLLKDTIFKGKNVLVVSGQEATESWRSSLESECRRLALPLTYLPSGFIFAPFQSPEIMFQTLNNHLQSPQDAVSQH